MKRNSVYFKWGLTAFLVIIFSIIGAYIIFHVSIFSSNISKLFKILTPIIEGIVMAYLMAPFLNTVERRFIIPLFSLFKKSDKKKPIRLISTLITIVFFLLLFYGFFNLVIPQIANSIRTIIEQFPIYQQTIANWLYKVLDDYPDIEPMIIDLYNKYSVEVSQFINKTIVPQINNLIMTVSLSIVQIVKQCFNLIIALIVSIYLLNSKEVLSAQAKKIAYSIFSIDSANRYISNMRFSSKTFGGFIIGKIVDSAIIGVLCYMGTSLIGTPFSVLVSVIIGVTNIIPFFGPFLGAVPSLLLIVLVNPIQALYFLIFVMILQQVDGNIIGPKILGSSTGLSSFWVIFSITLFGGLWGVTGMILGVPIFAVIFSFIKSTVENRLVLKELPAETSKYLKLLYIDTESLELVQYAKKEKSAFEDLTKIIVKSQNKIKYKESKKENNDNNSNDM